MFDTPAAEPHKAVQHESLFDEVKDFGQSFVHSAVENPINGLIQFVDHTANVHIPELKIVGAPDHQSFGTMAGAVVGTAVDLIAVTAATGGLAEVVGATGAVAGLVTAATTGALYGGILTPSDDKSQHFYTDRLTNGAIGAAAFATMSGAAALLGETGLFAATAERSLLGNVAVGGLSGAAGGAAAAETTAVLKDHKPFPSAEELLHDVTTMAAFGAAYGGISWTLGNVGRATPKPENAPKSEGGSGAESTNPPETDIPPVLPPLRPPEIRVENKVDKSGRVIEVNDGAPWTNRAQVWNSAEDGRVSTLFVQNSGNEPSIWFHRTEPFLDTWKVRTGKATYDWRGEIEAIADPATGNISGYRLHSKGGQEATFDVRTGTGPLLEGLKPSSDFKPSADDGPYGILNADGTFTIRLGDWRDARVNDMRVRTEEVKILPNDTVTVNFDLEGLPNIDGKFSLDRGLPPLAESQEMEVFLRTEGGKYTINEHPIEIGQPVFLREIHRDDMARAEKTMNDLWPWKNK